VNDFSTEVHSFPILTRSNCFLKRHPNSHTTLTNDRSVKVSRFLVFNKVKVKLLIFLKIWLTALRFRVFFLFIGKSVIKLFLK